MRALFFVSLLGLTACDGPDPDTGASTDTDDSFGFDTALPDLTEVRGIVLGADAQPVEGVQVDLCLTVCRTGYSDASGAFSVLGNPGAQHSLHVHGAQGMAEMLVPFMVSADFSEPQEVNASLRALEAPKSLSTTATEVEVASGLFVTAKQGDLSLELTGTPVNEVSGVRMELEAALPIGLDGEVLGIWHLDPYEATQSGGTPVSIANTFTLAEGATLKLYTASYNDFDWIEEGELMVQESTGRLSAEGVTLSRFTTAVLVATEGS